MSFMSCLGLGPSPPTALHPTSADRHAGSSLTESELQTLEAVFIENQSPDQETFELLANQWNVTTAQVQVNILFTLPFSLGPKSLPILF